MHKLHIIPQPNGTLLVVAVLNPGVPWHYAEKTASELKAQFGPAKIVVVPYATGVQVHSRTLWGAVKAWWTGRKLRHEGELKA